MRGAGFPLILMAFVAASEGAAKPANPIQAPYFSKVEKISGGLVRPVKDGEYPESYNRIFSVDLEGNGSRYISSYGIMNRNTPSKSPNVDIDPVLSDGKKRALKKAELVILILNDKEGGRLTILPFASPEQDMSVQIRPLRRKGKDRFIPYVAERCSGWIPRDRDAVSWGDSGAAELIYFKKGWKHLSCDDGQ